MKPNSIFIKGISRTPICKSDNKNTRHAKKAFIRRLKSKEKKAQRNRKLSHDNSLKWSIYPKPVKQKRAFGQYIKFTKGVEQFCKQNNRKEFQKKTTNIVLTEDFDLFKDPNVVHKILLQLLFDAKNRKQNANITYTGNVSFGALYLLDTICWEIFDKSPKWHLNPTNISERNYTIQSKLKSFKTGETESTNGYIYNNKIKINRSNDKLAHQDHKAASKTVRHLINKGISDVKNEEHEFSPVENGALESAISEHFDNILLHVPDAEFGYLCSFFDRIEKKITILIFNYGLTIAQSLNGSEIPDNVKAVIDEVITNYSKRSFFGLGSNFTEENALTLLAIQEGISSKLVEDKSRGFGIMDFIEHCKQMNSESQITIISGKTALKINENTIVSTRNVFGRDRRVIAFNKENDLMEKPNDDSVLNLDYFFPGVIIETVIPINI